jgi:hypothetical protein
VEELSNVIILSSNISLGFALSHHFFLCVFFPFLVNNVQLVPTAPAVSTFSFCNAVTLCFIVGRSCDKENSCLT